jgi:hypothetical protein
MQVSRKSKAFLVLYIEAGVESRSAQASLEYKTAKLASILGVCHFFVVNNALEACEAAETLNIDLIIVEEYVTPMYCMAFAQILRNAGCPIPIIVKKSDRCLSLTGDETLLFCGFLCNDYSDNDLCDAIMLALDPNSAKRKALGSGSSNIISSSDSMQVNEIGVSFKFNPDQNGLDLEVLNAVTRLASHGAIADYTMLRKKVKAEKFDDTYMTSLISPTPNNGIDHNIFGVTSTTLPACLDYGFQLMPNINAVYDPDDMPQGTNPNPSTPILSFLTILTCRLAIDIFS